MKPSPSLKAISIQSENASETCHQIIRHIGQQVGISIEFINDMPWQEREHLLDTQQAHLGWICGLPYVWKADQASSPIELIAAPVMQHPRYQQQPIYYSDVIVNRESDYYHFADLRGASWAYNEPHSQSGYNITRYHLAVRGEHNGYFSQVVEAGSHLQSLDMVLEQRIDATAIDSTVFEMELAVRPDLKRKVRVIETFRPSPMPPWVITRNVPSALREAIRRAFWQMHGTTEGQAILSQGQIQRMAQVEDRDYDPIRDMARVAAQVVW